MMTGDPLVAIVGIVAVFGPLFYVIYLTGKLIRYRIDKKYKAEHAVHADAMRQFMDRTDQRLRALEEIASADDNSIRVNSESGTSSGSHQILDEESSPKQNSDDIWEDSRGKLKNQLKT